MVRALPAVLAVAVAVAGCNSDDDGDAGKRGASSTKSAPADRQPAGAAGKAAPADERAIRALVVRLFRSSDVAWVCTRSLTPRLFARLYDGRAACRKAAADDEDDKPPRRVEVSRVETRGAGSGTAEVLLVGGDTGGAKGAVSLIKAGGDWRLDDFTTPFLRSLMQASLRNDDDVPPATGRCIGRRLERIPDERFKRLSFGLLGEKRRASVQLLTLWSECERGVRGVSSLRRPLEASIRRQLRRRGASPRVITCVVGRLRQTLPDRLLISLIAADDRRSRQRLAREGAAAAIACGVEPRSEPGPGLSPA